MSKIYALREERGTLAKEVRNLLDKHPGKEWGPDQQKAYDTHLERIEALDGAIQREQKAIDLLAAEGQEVERIADYLALMAIRMGPRLQVQLDLPEALRQQAVPPLLLQPLVENSIQHGLEPKVEGGSIRVSASRQGELLCLEVEDTGLGLPPADAHRPGFGLQQVRERLSTTFGALGTIKIGAANEEGTRVNITFPLKT